MGTIKGEGHNDPRGVYTPYRLTTPCCGKLCLTEEEYVAQMDKPDARWMCPLHNQVSRWDDYWYDAFLEDSTELDN